LRDVALVGGGAIGTAVALILRELGAEGSLAVVDPQLFEDPNVTTYSLGTREDARTQIRKVDLIQRELPGVEVVTFEGTAQDLVSAIDDGRMGMPAVVLGAVDSVEARHEIAAIHAQRTLDGSTGGDTGTMLSLAEATWAGPCLRC
jgi:glycerol-3-phosphate dehydrogenase